MVGIGAGAWVWWFCFGRARALPRGVQVPSYAVGGGCACGVAGSFRVGTVRYVALVWWLCLGGLVWFGFVALVVWWVW